MAYFLILFGWLTAVGVYQNFKPLPEGLDYESAVHLVSEEDIDFIFDLTYEDSLGNIIHEQEIFDTIDSLVVNAQKYILIDMFLFNSFKGPGNYAYRELSPFLTNRLIEQKSKYPDLKIDFITDPLNTLYGGYRAPELKLLRDNDINIIVTDMRRSRDNVYLFSPVWRTFIQWFGNSDNGGWLKHPLLTDGDKITLRSYLAFGNLKANHRKVVVTDSGDDMISLITSHNTHSASSDFSNVGLMVKGDIYKDILLSERAIANFSKSALQLDLDRNQKPSIVNEDYFKVKFLTETKIKQELINSFKNLGTGDSLRIAAFYLSQREIIRSLLRAVKNGANVKIILDPNQHGFGYDKTGIPNQPVAHELLKKSKGNLKLRWYLTHGEQFHTKFNYIKYIDGTSKVILGNSNLTKKNLDGYNLEAELVVSGNTNSELMKELDKYFERIWNNWDGNVYTVNYEQFKDISFIKKFRYRFGEAVGTAVY